MPVAEDSGLSGGELDRHDRDDPDEDFRKAARVGYPDHGRDNSSHDDSDAANAERNDGVHFTI